MSDFYRPIMDEPLVIWIKTFDHEVTSGPLNTIHQLTDGVYLLEVMSIIENQSADKSIIYNVYDARARLSNLELLYRHIRLFYESSLRQVVMVSPPDLVCISQDPHLDKMKIDFMRILLLILGCATQCYRKQEFIENMHSLPDYVQTELMECFKELAENTMSSIEQHLSMDESMRTLYLHVCRLVQERDKLLEQMAAYFLGKLSTGGLLELGASSSSSLPRSPLQITSNHDYDQLKTDFHQARSKIESLSGELTDSSIKIQELRRELDNKVSEIRRLKTENVRLSQQNGSKSVSSDAQILKEKLDQAMEKLRKSEKLENDIYRLRQQLSEMEFYKTRVQELRDDNSGLIEEKQRLEDLLANSRRKEEDVIERLVENQIKLDEITAEREADRRRIEELMEMNLQMESDLKQWRAAGSCSDLHRDSHSGKDGTSRINELQKEVEALKTRLMDSQKQAEQKENKWKFLEVQKEKLEIRRELTKLKESTEKDRTKLAESEARIKTLHKEKDQMAQEISLIKLGHDDHTKDLEQKIKELTNQVMILRRKGAKLANAQFREMELKEMELMYQSVQELTTQMARLKANNKILRQSCDKLKEDVDKIIGIEEENERLARENRDLRRGLASQNTNSEQSDDLRRKNLQLEIENKKLRRIIESLRVTLVQIDPYNRMKYHYITSI